MSHINQDTIYHLFNGSLTDAYRFFGAHLIKEEGIIKATRFTVFAPNAKTVSVIGPFNNYNIGAHKLQKLDNRGIFSITIEDNLARVPYKYHLLTHDDKGLYKSDPFATYSAYRPETLSIVSDPDLYTWGDDSYMEKRYQESPYTRPMNIYEVHLGTWMQKPNGDFHSYVDLVEHLIPYVQKHHFTHIEILPLIEHPFDGSWGYQGTGYYSLTSRYGTIDDFKYFVDQCHQAGIKVILDWVPGHFCKDDHGLYFFDGTPLFEYDDEKHRENQAWGTVNFDLSKGHTQSFLISSALYFMKNYHVDGFRVDAVSYMLYYHGDTTQKENQGAIEFLQKLSKDIFAYHPNALLIAEDSSAYPKVTHPIEHGGLGFNFKWNMGWMNDTLKYFEKDPIHRKYHHDLMTFSLMYAFSENYILPFSHDEVVHGKKTLVDKMPGDYWQKFANYRALIGYLHTHPGKNLLFMGQEFAQMHEWKDYTELDWHLLSYPMHESALHFCSDMNALSKSEKALHELDHKSEGFAWIDADNADYSVLSFIRKSQDEKECLIVVLNLTPEVHHQFPIGVPKAGKYVEIINSDYQIYGGSNLYNGLPLETKNDAYKNFNYTIEMLLSPLSISILKFVEER